MTRKFPNLAGLAQAIDKVHFDIEEEAKKIVEQEVPVVVQQKNEVFAKARTSLKAGSDAVQDIAEQLRKADEALGDNSGNPTGGSGS